MKSYLIGENDHTLTLDYTSLIDWLEKYQENKEKCWQRAFEKGIVEGLENVIVNKDDLPEGEI